MITFLLILVVLLLVYLAIVGAALFDIFVKVKADMESMLDMKTRETAKDIAEHLYNDGFRLNQNGIQRVK